MVVFTRGFTGLSLPPGSAVSWGGFRLFAGFLAQFPSGPLMPAMKKILELQHLEDED